MKYLLRNKQLVFAFGPNYVTCYTTNYRYQSNGILSFAILDLAYKIIKQHKKIDYITLKKGKPIIHLLNYIDVLNFNSKEFDISFFLADKRKNQLAQSLCYYRCKYFNEKDMLKVIEHENAYIIRFADPVCRTFVTRIQPQNANLVAMLLHILEPIVEKEKSNEINVSGIIFYCVLLA